MRLPVEIVCNGLFFVDCDTNNFGRIFAASSDKDQVAILRAMVEHMKSHRIQWDYIWIELNKPENADVLQQLQECFVQIDNPIINNGSR